MNPLTNNHNLPESIVNAIMNDPYDGPTDLSSISVTTLISPPKIRMLKHRHKDEIEEDVSDQIWKLLGTSVHAMIERAETTDALVEERLTMKVGDKTVSGKTDIYTSEKEIQDYKVTSVWSIVHSPEGKKEWTEQLNCLALLYRNAGFEVKSLKIIAILRDWQGSKAKMDPSYPQIPIVQIDVPLWTQHEQTMWMTTRVIWHERNENLPDDEIPICQPEERWQTQTKFAVMKNDNKRADKVFDSSGEAMLHISGKGLEGGKNVYTIQERPGEDKRCAQYCPVAKFCNHGRIVLAGIKPLEEAV